MVPPAATRVLTCKTCNAAHHVHSAAAHCVIGAAPKQQGAICASGGGPAGWGPHPVAEHRVDPGSQEEGIHLQAGELVSSGVQQHSRGVCLAQGPPGRYAVRTSAGELTPSGWAHWVDPGGCRQATDNCRQKWFTVLVGQS